MNTPAQPTVALAMRSYSGQVELHDHDFPQIVLPQSGAMEIEVDGRGGKVDASQGVVIAPGARHSFLAERRNTFLVLDLDSPGCEPSLADTRFFAIDPQIRHLLGYASHSGVSLSSCSQVASAWSALLLACLARPTPSAPQRQALARALAHIEQHLGSPLSARAIDLLGRTLLPISEIAQRVGYADQSALTHALKKARNQTPAALRKAARDAQAQAATRLRQA
ncbi:AraC family transcriptional regulator [Pseudomonas chlororaphis]|uniref:AraC family transcriptional regulator n=1 Tax=Pseudomonas chlororaphis TaxID=587753 RepID=UPI001CF19276|nr:AraC family transcriptional regulator [Pseudomonas chlororaphis]UCR87464.1 AraC family transcriptional regulator [Pseudomonas chlororaphis]